MFHQPVNVSTKPSLPFTVSAYESLLFFHHLHAISNCESRTKSPKHLPRIVVAWHDANDSDDPASFVSTSLASIVDVVASRHRPDGGHVPDICFPMAPQLRDDGTCLHELRHSKSCLVADHRQTWVIHRPWSSLDTPLQDCCTNFPYGLTIRTDLNGGKSSKQDLEKSSRQDLDADELQDLILAREKFFRGQSRRDKNRLELVLSTASRFYRKGAPPVLEILVQRRDE